MPVARLLAVIVICTCSALAQQQNSTPQQAPSELLEDYNFLTALPASASAEPWRIIPERSQQEGSAQATPNIPLNDQDKVNAMAERAARLFASMPHDPNSQSWVTFSPDGKIAEWGDPTCYSIHSYVVARDSKNSDAVHRVSESTCVPASRYGVKTTVMKSATSDR